MRKLRAISVRRGMSESGGVKLMRPSKGYGSEVDEKVWQRIEASMNFCEGDRVTIWDYIDNPAVVAHFRQEGDDYETAMVRVYHGLGIDLCRGYGSSFEPSQEGTVIGEGKGQRKVSGQTAWKVRYEIENLDELREYVSKAEPVSWDWIRTHWVSWVRQQQQKFAPFTVFVPGRGCGFHDAYGLMGQERFAYAIYDAPKEVRALLEITGETAFRFAKVAAEEQLCPLYFIGDDIAYKTACCFRFRFCAKLSCPCSSAALSHSTMPASKSSSTAMATFGKSLTICLIRELTVSIPLSLWLAWIWAN